MDTKKFASSNLLTWKIKQKKESVTHLCNCATFGILTNLSFELFLLLA